MPHFGPKFESRETDREDDSKVSLGQPSDEVINHSSHNQEQRDYYAENEALHRYNHQLPVNGSQRYQNVLNHYANSSNKYASYVPDTCTVFSLELKE